MLAPLALAVSLGLSQQPAPIAAPFKLSLNGNAIVVSAALAAGMGGSPTSRIEQPDRTAMEFVKAIRGLSRKPVIAIVHRFSSHALMLRYWLAYAGIDPEHDIELKVLPPPFMADALAAGAIDGFSAGEPWNSAAVDLGAGEIVAFGCRIWESGPEKVLAMREDWTEANPEPVDRLLRALDQAAAWCDQAENQSELARLLAREAYIGAPAALIERGLSGRIQLTARGDVAEADNFLMFHRQAANFPWRSQALWIYSQLVRWGFIAHSDRTQRIASGVFRSDIYRRAIAGGQTALPVASLKVEGSLDALQGVASDRGTLALGPDRFFDGRVFDPMKIGEYLTQLAD
jgi:NitT/TauT family transport system ATP-binding protein